jgi:quinoprotein glucose dehydrogenase
MDGDGTPTSTPSSPTDSDDPAAGIGAGLLDNGGYVYFTCIPDLWLLHDGDGDGRPRSRNASRAATECTSRSWATTCTACASGPTASCTSRAATAACNVETERGVVDNVLSGAVLRCNLDGSELEIFATGLRNPQELASTSSATLHRRQTTPTARPARAGERRRGRGFGLALQLPVPDRAVAARSVERRRPVEAALRRTGAYILPPIANLAPRAFGPVLPPGHGLSTAYQKHFFLVDFEGDPRYSGILSFTHTPKGASFELGPVEEFVWNCLPTDVDFGPDGSLYWCDWVFGWQKPNKGRVYRVRADPAIADPAAATTRELLSQGMRKRTPAELGALLRNADQRVRQAAELELAGRGAQASRRCRRRPRTARRSRRAWRASGAWASSRAATRRSPRSCGRCSTTPIPKRVRRARACSAICATRRAGSA